MNNSVYLAIGAGGLAAGKLSRIDAGQIMVMGVLAAIIVGGAAVKRPSSSLRWLFGWVALVAGGVVVLVAITSVI